MFGIRFFLNIFCVVSPREVKQEVNKCIFKPQALYTEFYDNKKMYSGCICDSFIRFSKHLRDNEEFPLMYANIVKILIYIYRHIRHIKQKVIVVMMCLTLYCVV